MRRIHARTHSLSHVRIHYVANASSAPLPWTGAHDATRRELTKVRGASVRLPLKKTGSYVARRARSGDDLGLHAVVRDAFTQRVVINHVVALPARVSLAQGEVVATGADSEARSVPVPGDGRPGVAVETGVVNEATPTRVGTEHGAGVTTGEVREARPTLVERESGAVIQVGLDPTHSGAHVATETDASSLPVTTGETQDGARARTKD